MSDSEVDTRYVALLMALEMTFFDEEGRSVRLGVSEAIEAARQFEAFMVAKAE